MADSPNVPQQIPAPAPQAPVTQPQAPAIDPKYQSFEQWQENQKLAEMSRRIEELSAAVEKEKSVNAQTEHKLKASQFSLLLKEAGCVDPASAIKLLDLSNYSEESAGEILKAAQEKFGYMFKSPDPAPQNPATPAVTPTPAGANPGVHVSEFSIEAIGEMSLEELRKHQKEILKRRT